MLCVNTVDETIWRGHQIIQQGYLNQQSLQFEQFWQIGLCLQYLGNYNEAIDNFNKAINLNPMEQNIFQNV
ncbi:unnamed protein product [Paramecium octaurelia]|uniref:Tetratricopeptide repeat protein n=1 Tax=Paramecium octaurelia TaxID=43137 RepID=A0A8S1XYJ5_PAROT|nr:unnamed protein product [Paramecium octaurelia]